MRTWLRRLVVLVMGLVLLVSPVLLIRSLGGHSPAMGDPYEPPEVQLPDLAAAPIPTSTPVKAPDRGGDDQIEAGSGKVVVDLAHFTSLGPTQFQPLADHLADYGLDLTFWMSDTDLLDLNFDTMADLPDQSAQLEELLYDATGLVVVNPAFWWTPEEIALVEDFVADGGRLILISDPDVPDPPEFYVPDINSLSDAFGIVFNKDYLYNVKNNDLNFTHVFQEQFSDQAAGMRGQSIVFYGARSISGPALPQIRTGEGTVSSLRAGREDFTTVAIGGQPDEVLGRNVLALGDFDVLTEPYVNRYDNQQVVQFVARFLAESQRAETLTDFPAYLGQDVGLLFGEDMPISEEMLITASRLQRFVEDSGRQMVLVNASQVVLTGTVPLTAANQDLVFVGSYEYAASETRLLADSGIHLTVEPVESSDVPTTTLAIDAEEEDQVEAETQTEDAQQSAAASSEDAAEAEETEDTEKINTESLTGTMVLEMETGPRFVAADTVILLRQQDSQGHWVTAALGNSADTEDGMVAGIDRLLSDNFSDCLTYPDMAICPVGGQVAAEETDDDDEIYLPPSSQLPSSDDEEPIDIPLRTSDILLIDDDSLAQENEVSEGDIYFSALLDAGYFPDLWYTSLDGIPDSTNLSGYKWVIWSAGEYQENNLDFNQLETLITAFDEGSAITMSAWQLPMEYGEAASALVDVVIGQDIPDLVDGLPTDPIALPEGLPLVVPLPQPEGDEAAPLLRGTESDDAGAPVMIVAGYDGPPAAGEPQAIVLAMSLTWLPEENAAQLVTNMLQWVIAE